MYLAYYAALIVRDDADVTGGKTITKGVSLLLAIADLQSSLSHDRSPKFVIYNISIINRNVNSTGVKNKVIKFFLGFNCTMNYNLVSKGLQVSKYWFR